MVWDVDCGMCVWWERYRDGIKLLLYRIPTLMVILFGDSILTFTFFHLEQFLN